MSDLVADGLNISINAQEALDWLMQFLESHKFSYPAAERDRQFAQVLIAGLRNERPLRSTFGCKEVGRKIVISDGTAVSGLEGIIVGQYDKETHPTVLFRVYIPDRNRFVDVYSDGMKSAD